jgi:ubiquinone/menaquinone biosynthesis C-methylase UbiE
VEGGILYESRSKEMKAEESRNRWERIYHEQPLEEVPWEEGRPSVELIKLVESGVVDKGAALDICCGSANNAIYLARQGFTCYGIDISPTAIGYGKEKVAKAGISCEISLGNVLELPYPDNTFTLVFDRGCFHNIAPEDRQTFIRGVRRVLKPSGKYQLICFSSKDLPSSQVPYSFSPEDIRHLFSPLFNIHHIREISGKEADGTNHYFLSVLTEKAS